MAPALVEGDEVLLAPREGPPEPGEVVVARGPRGLVLHRVLAVREGAVITRGDACQRSDPAVAPAAVLLRAVQVRRRGRVGRIPRPPVRQALRRGLSRIMRNLGLRRGSPGRSSKERP